MSNHTMYEGEKSKVIWPLALIIGLVPLIVRLKVLSVPQATQWLWGDDQGYFSDFFSANKLILLTVLTLISLVLFAVEFDKKNQYKNKAIYSCLGVYILLAGLSTVFAAKGEKLVALLGSPGRYEGLLAILCYSVTAVLAMYLAQEWWNVKFLYKALSIGAIAMGIIGLSQFLGFDLLQTDGGKSLMLPFEYMDMADGLNFVFGSHRSHRVYGTLFNPNYVGSYAAMLMPISVVGMLYTYLYKKELGEKVFATVFAGLMASLWLTSHSRGGLVGGILALILILILLYKNFIKTKAHLGIFLSLAIASGVIVNMVSGGTISNSLFTLPKEVVKMLGPSEEVSRLKDIRLEEDAIEIESNLPTFRIERQDDGIILKDASGNLIPVVEEEGNLIPQDASFEGMYIEFSSPEEFRLHMTHSDGGRYPLYFVYVGDQLPGEGYRIVGGSGRALDMKEVPSWGFEEKERVGSSRGYIWSRTFPMVKDTWLLGHGPDTYALHFPQHDIIGKVNAFNDPTIVVDKPHNLYLQTAVSTGGLSLVVLLVLFGLYFVLWVKHIRSTDQDDIRRWMSIGIFAAICGYLVAGLFNDSTISVAPVFWVLWGLGIGLTSNANPPRFIKKRG